MTDLEHPETRSLIKVLQLLSYMDISTMYNNVKKLVNQLACLWLMQMPPILTFCII